MGIVASKDLRREIVKGTGITEMEASLLLRDIDDSILRPVKDLMFTMYAEGAPFKPKDSQTMNETEADHQELKKEDILNEIENPTPAEVKKVTINIPEIRGSREVKRETVVKKKLVGKLSSSHELEEYKNELTTTSPKLVAKSSEPSYDLEESKRRILDNVGSIKLAGVVTMPKMRQEIQESLPETPKKNIPESEPVPTRKIIDIKKPLAEAISSAPQTANVSQNVSPSKIPAATPKTEVVKTSGADPYREPIE